MIRYSNIIQNGKGQLLALRETKQSPEESMMWSEEVYQMKLNKNLQKLTENT